MNAAVTDARFDLATYADTERRRAVWHEVDAKYARQALRPLAALDLPEDSQDTAEGIAAARKTYPDDMQIEDNDLPLTYGHVRAAREAYSQWGVHPDIWDRHMARRTAEKQS